MGVGIALLLAGVRCEKFYTHPPQSFLRFGRVVVAIPDEEDAGGELDELWDYAELVDIGRSYRKAGDEPRPAETLTCTLKP